MKTLFLKLSLNQLRCHVKPDAWIGGEPYMWNVFFKIDGEGIVMNDQFRLEGKPIYHFSEGSHGNLDARGMEEGAKIGISKSVGEWKTSLVPLTIPVFEAHISGLVGVVSVLIEQNYVSSKGAEAGHKALNEYICNAIDRAIVGFDPRRVDIQDVDRSIKTYFDAQVREFTAGIGNLVGEAVSKSQTLAQNIFSLVKKDVLIGFKVFDFSNKGIELAGGNIDFSHHFTGKKVGDWEVRGNVVCSPDTEENNAIR
jgi:hypothetical protein